MNNEKSKLITIRINTNALNNIEAQGKELDRSRNYLINKTLCEKFLNNSMVTD